MPGFATDNNHISRTRNSLRSGSFVDEAKQGGEDLSISNLLGDTLETVDNLWQPRFGADRASVSSYRIASKRDDNTLPQRGANESVRSFDSAVSPQGIKWRPLLVPEAIASPKELLQNRRSSLSAVSASTFELSESKNGLFSDNLVEMPQSPRKITRRALPARKPIPVSSAMGPQESKVDDSNSSKTSSLQQPPDSADAASQYSSPIPSRPTTFEVSFTPPNSSPLRQDFTSNQQPEASNLPVRSHSRGKSNTALHILHSFPTVPNNNSNNSNTLHDRSHSSTNSISFRPAPPPYTSSKDTPVVPPITSAHYACYHSHRSMQLSRNIYAPVPCMTCYLDDQDLRWTCTWCCLRICRQCLGVLESSRGRDLSEMLSAIGRRGANTTI